MDEELSQITIFDIIRSVLPDGPAAGATGWDKVCDWPPDLFAVVATITERSGLYSDRAFTATWSPNFILSDTWIEKTREIGRQWATQKAAPQAVQDLWDQLIQSRKSLIADTSSDSNAWKSVTFQLLSIADEACAGVGFRPPPKDGNSVSRVQYTVYEDYIAWEEEVYKAGERPGSTILLGGEVLPYIPCSLCIRVPPALLCVQPKTSTPAVGCTLRSLTHHLALLPSIANVATHWHLADRQAVPRQPFNMLLVPFPYVLPGKSFQAIASRFTSGSLGEPVFRLDPDQWMQGVTANEFADFLCALIDASSSELERVHAIVLPENALKLEFANSVAQILASKTNLDLFIAGVMADEGGEVRNSAAIYRFIGDDHYIPKSFQSKHHRWCLDGPQIEQYHLGQVLDPHNKWWEQIDVSFRNCYVTLFRSGATLSVLVCEDLARYDPVLTVMNAIGPNLVIALLLDGPQIAERWPARYATVLADDPGSSVLTLLAGMIFGDHDGRVTKCSGHFPA